MVDKISSGGDSEFVKAKKYFRPNCSKAKDEVVVFVEGLKDIPFWHCFFEKFEKNKSIQIKTLRIDNEELRGKDSLVKYIGLHSLGSNKLIAVDSDYDNIIDEYHDYTQDLRRCKYAICTIDTYGIENHKILHSILKEAIYKISCCSQIEEDIENMILQFSNTIYNLFTIHLFSLYKKDKKYSESDFKKDLNGITFSAGALDQKSINAIQQRLENLNIYLENNKQEYDIFLSELSKKGVNEDNCWQFINGHDVFEEIGVKVVCVVTDKYIPEKFKELKSAKKNRENLMNEYKKNVAGSRKDRIRQILYDRNPDLEWGTSKKIITSIEKAFLDK